MTWEEEDIDICFIHISYFLSHPTHLPA